MAGPSAGLSEWLNGVLGADSPVRTPELEAELVQVLTSAASNDFAKSTAAYVAGHHKLKSALPALVAALGQHWVDTGTFALRQSNPETAIVMMGIDAKPAIEDYLLTATNPMLISLAASMIYHVTNHLDHTRQAVEKAKNSRPAADAPLFDEVLADISTWGG